MEEAYVEHDGAKVMIAEIEAGSPEDEFYDAKMKVLSEQIEHHVKEEEQRVEGMFAQAKAAGVDTDALGDKMAAEKKTTGRQIQGIGTSQASNTFLYRHPAGLTGAVGAM